MRVALLCLALAACSRPLVEANIGGFVVRVEPETARFVVSRADGTALVEGLAAEINVAGTPPRGVAFRPDTSTVLQSYGSYLFTDSTAAWQVVTSFDHVAVSAGSVTFTLAGVDGTGEIAAQADGRLGITLSQAAAGAHTSLALRAVDGEHYLGLGAHTQDLDHRGHVVPSWVSEQGVGQTDSDEPSAAWFLQGTRNQTYFPVPFMLSSRGYGLEVMGVSRSIFSLAAEAPDLLRLENWDDKLELTLYDGPTLPEVLARRQATITTPPVPPDWTFAPWNDAIYGSTNVRRVAGVLRDNKIPSAAIWTEDWAGGTQSGKDYRLTYEWKVDRSLYPDVEILASDLHAQGFRFLGYFNTFVESDASHFAEVRDAGYLVAQADGTPEIFQGPRFVDSGLLDLSNDAARTYLAGKLDAALDLGFDGWMADYAEWLPTDGKLASGELGLDVHDRYPVDWQSLNQSVLSARSSGAELLSFVRSGYAASAGIANQVVWGGDQLPSFAPDDGLPTVLPLALGLGLSGLPYFGSDIGGYTNIDTLPARTQEVFFRWASLGALSVVMRTHHGGWPMLNWSFEEDAATLAHYGRWARVHVRLFPYLKALAQHVAGSGLPIMRPLALAFPDDDDGYTDLEEMMLGPSLLVAPVVTEGANSRTVHLPVGTWLPLGFGSDGGPSSGGAAIAGGQTVTATAAMTELPVYLRAGSLVSMLPPGVDTLATVDASAGVVGLSQLGSARVLLVGLGADADAEAAQATDDLGGTYMLAPTAAPVSTPTLRFAGAALSACPSSTSCVADAAGAQARVQVIGNGTLEIVDGATTVASIVVAGRAPDAVLEVVVIW